MRVTIKDIAKAANVSYSTVSRALAGQPQIPEETRNKILALANEMGYTPNILAKGLVTKSTHTLGIIVPDITNPGNRGAGKQLRLPRLPVQFELEYRKGKGMSA